MLRKAKIKIDGQSIKGEYVVLNELAIEIVVLIIKHQDKYYRLLDNHSVKAEDK